MERCYGKGLVEKPWAKGQLELKAIVREGRPSLVNFRQSHELTIDTQLCIRDVLTGARYDEKDHGSLTITLELTPPPDD